KRAQAIGQPFMLHSCTREPGRTAFLPDLRALETAGRAAIHHDGGDPAKGLDIAALLREHQPGTHLYYCGPAAFMKAVADASAHWPSGTVHFEFFSPQLREPAPRKEPSPGLPPGVEFRVRLASSGAVYDVPHDVSIVEVLRQHGIEVPTSCEAGVCGSCRVRYLSGRPDHRDYLLEDSEREEELLACCARSLDSEIELDM
ncbi:MAG: flavin reductase family protein, partial [Hyphomicrobiales bacterium]